MARGRTGLVVADAGALEADSARDEGEANGQGAAVGVCAPGEEVEDSALGSEVVRLRGNTHACEEKRGTHHNVEEMDFGVDARSMGQSMDRCERVEEGLHLPGSQDGDGVGAAEELSVDVGGCNQRKHSVGF